MSGVKIIAVFVCLLAGSAVGSARKLSRDSGHQRSSPARNIEPPPHIPQNMTDANSYDKEEMEIMSLCNATFPTPMDHLTQLYETGEFPPTAGRDSKCFLDCIFTRMKIFDEKRNIDKSAAKKKFGEEEQDEQRKAMAVEKCFSEGDKTEDACELSYNRIICLTKDSLDHEKEKNGKGDKM